MRAVRDTSSLGAGGLPGRPAAGGTVVGRLGLQSGLVGTEPGSGGTRLPGAAGGGWVGIDALPGTWSGTTLPGRVGRQTGRLGARVHSFAATATPYGVESVFTSPTLSSSPLQLGVCLNNAKWSAWYAAGDCLLFVYARPADASDPDGDNLLQLAWTADWLVNDYGIDFVDREVGENADQACVATGPAGTEGESEVAVVWVDKASGSTDRSLWMALASSGFAAFRLRDGPDCSHPCVVVDASGVVHVAWTERESRTSTTASRIRMYRCVPGGPSTFRTLSDEGEPEGSEADGEADFPTLAVTVDGDDTVGTLLVAWQREEAGKKSVWARAIALSDYGSAADWGSADVAVAVGERSDIEFRDPCAWAPPAGPFFVGCTSQAIGEASRIVTSEKSNPAGGGNWSDPILVDKGDDDDESQNFVTGACVDSAGQSVLFYEYGPTAASSSRKVYGAFKAVSATGWTPFEDAGSPTGRADFSRTDYPDDWSEGPEGRAPTGEQGQVPSVALSSAGDFHLILITGQEGASPAQPPELGFLHGVLP